MGNVTVASTAKVGNTTFWADSGNITIEDFVFFGANVSLVTGTHDFALKDMARQRAFPKTGRDITIRQGVWICANVLILGPCVIGENSVIGAGCIITGNIPANTLIRLKQEQTQEKIRFKT